MTGVVEKNYSEAFFQVIEEENQDMKSILNELEAVNGILEQCPELIKLSGAPTIENSEKQEIIDEAFKNKVSEYVYNFISLLTESKRLSYFNRIYRAFKELYNEKFNIADITVISPFRLKKQTKIEIKEKMDKVTGKNVNIIEKIDKSLIGGIIINYGSERYDGSVKTRLEALKQEISGLI